MRTATAFLAGVLLLGAAPAFAQEKPVDVNIGGGYTFALSDVRDHLGDGYNINIGATVNLSPTFGIQGEYSFNGLGQKQISIPVSGTPGGTPVPTDFFADMNMQYFDANLVFKTGAEGSAHPYIVAGGGWYHRPVKVTTPGVGYIPGYCDPWWYVCYPGGFVPVENIIGERSSNDFGVDFGAGVDIGPADGPRLFIEAKYHYIWGPEVKTSATGTETKKANGQFLPFTIGLRF